jgi:pectate lyase
MVLLEQAVDREEVMAGWIKSEGDLFLNGAQPSLIDGPGGDCVFKAEEMCQPWTMEPASHSLRDVLQLCTGWQDIPRPPDC